MTPRKEKVIALDFDGTVVTHDYPAVGRDIGAEPVLKKLVARGHKLVLNTMRSGSKLREAEQWFIDRGIPLYGSNKNPTQHTWTQSPKVFAHIYIDDASLGCPLTYAPEIERPYVDWTAVSEMLEKML